MVSDVHWLMTDFLNFSVLSIGDMWLTFNESIVMYLLGNQLYIYHGSCIMTGRVFQPWALSYPRGMSYAQPSIIYEVLNRNWLSWIRYKLLGAQAMLENCDVGFASISHRPHFGSTAMSLRNHFKFNLKPRRFRFAILSMALSCHFGLSLICTCFSLWPHFVSKSNHFHPIAISLWCQFKKKIERTFISPQ